MWWVGTLRLSTASLMATTTRLPTLAAELVQRQVSVIFANSTPPAYAAKAATATIPIVFTTGVDPVEVGLVASMNRPGANVTGVTFLSNKLVAKRLELLCALVPGTTSIGMLAAQRNPNTETDARDALAAASVLGRTMHVEKVAPEGDIERPFAALIERGIGALFVAPQADFRIWRQQLVLFAMRHGLPTSFSNNDYVTAGGLMSYGPEPASILAVCSKVRSPRTFRCWLRRSSSSRSISTRQRRSV